jgi:hypothetical protein
MKIARVIDCQAKVAGTTQRIAPRHHEIAESFRGFAKEDYETAE